MSDKYYYQIRDGVDIDLLRREILNTPTGNQHYQIIKWLKTHKRPMTPMDAFRLNPPCTKLSTRIGEMIKAGYKIGKVWIDGKNRKKICRGYFLK